MSTDVPSTDVPSTDGPNTDAPRTARPTVPAAGTLITIAPTGAETAKADCPQLPHHAGPDCRREAWRPVVTRDGSWMTSLKDIHRRVSSPSDGAGLATARTITWGAIPA